jgi:hypothetical protein
MLDSKDRICGAYMPDYPHVLEGRPEMAVDAHYNWSEACNRVRWHPAS